MTTIPRDPAIDATLALRAEGYEFVANRCRRLNTDIFATRLLGRRIYCARGAEAARMFYEPDRFTRRGAIPNAVLHLLQDEGSVATLDAEAHRRRKAMFMSLMTPPRLQVMAELAAVGLRKRARGWPVERPVRLHDELRAVLCRAVCAWAGVPLDENRAEQLTGDIGAMIDHAASMGPSNWLARVRRWRPERQLARLVADIRAGEVDPPAESAARVIATHRDADGAPLDPDVCAAELLNIIRPTVAIARFVVFAALALHRHPEHRDRLRADDSFLAAFVQEVRRTTPFFPAVAGIARTPFEWRGHTFAKGDRVLLDLYGTDRDPTGWPDAASFRPERFLDWPGDPFTMVPQGGGSHDVNHRCAGEWLTIAVMRAQLAVLIREIAYDVPPQDLEIDLSSFPTLPRSGFMIVPLAGDADRPAPDDGGRSGLGTS